MKNRILKLIKNTAWTVSEDQENIKMLQIFDGKTKLNIYYGPMTVMIHDQKTHVQTVKKNVSLEELKIMLGVRTNFVQKFGEFMKQLGVIN